MARYETIARTTRSPQEVFAYLSDFTTTAEWDPGVVDAERLDSGPIAAGSRFRVRAAFLGRESELVYTITEYEPPRRVVLRGESATVVSLDEMSFEPDAGGTRVGYSADLRLKGPLRLLDPALGLAFKRVGDRAAAGLRRALAG